MGAPYYDKVDVDKKFDTYRKELFESLDSVNTEINGKVTTLEDLSLKEPGVYRAETSGIIGGIVVKEGYYTLLRKKEDGSWVLESEVKVDMSEYGGSNLIESSNSNEHKNSTLTTAVAKTGLAGFLYLELLDSTLSADGALAALVISKDIFIIAGGLAIGAMFVRSLTVQMVRSGTLNEFKYLEHGAFYAIATLSCIMFASTIIHIPEVITAVLSISFIVAGYYSSVKENKSFVRRDINCPVFCSS